MMKITTTILGFSALYFASVTQAGDLTRAIQTQTATNRLSIQSQQNIDRHTEESMALTSEIARLKEQLQNLSVYRDHLETLVASQQTEQASLTDQIAQIQQTRQGLVPLMYQMLSSLERIIKSDKPLKLSQRLSRLDSLRLMMGRADVSDAEKYRRILEAFQIEMDYGSKLMVYRDEIMTGENQYREVELASVGRLALIARSFNRQNYWYWDGNQELWMKGDDSDLEQINQIYDVAENKRTPTLLELPVSLVPLKEK